MMGFFSKREAYPVCGMFTIGHFAFLVVLFALIFLGLYRSRNATKEDIRKQTFIIAIVISSLEVFKIGYNHIYGYFEPDFWVPLSFCALLLYASWLSLAKNAFLARMGSIWISVGATIGGMAYLIYPSTSLTEVQAFHFLAFHGMGYHAVMVYLGLLFLLHEVCDPSVENLKYYVGFLGTIFTVVIAIDYIFQVNFMFFYDAWNLPKFVQAVANWNRPFYTFCVALFYIAFPYGISLGLRALRDIGRAKKLEEETELSDNSIH